MTVKEVDSVDEAMSDVPEGGPQDRVKAEIGRRSSRRFRLKGRWLALLLAVLLLGSAYLAVDQFQDWRHGRTQDHDREAAVAAADRVAVALATIRYKTADQDLKAVAALGTGGFARQIKENLSAQAKIVKKFKVDSTGQVKESGLVSLRGDTAIVAVAISSTVTNAEAADGEDRWYRVLITMTRRNDDSWLASNVEFVQ